MLGQAGLHLHTFPEVAFRLDRWTMQGYPCVLDKTPNRQLDVHVSARTVQCLFWSSHNRERHSPVNLWAAHAGWQDKSELPSDRAGPVIVLRQSAMHACADGSTQQ